MTTDTWNFVWCFLLGTLVSFIELYSRYDKPRMIITNFSSLTHLIVNGGMAVLAYYLIDKNGWLKDMEPLNMVLIASTSAMFIMRSSFANLKIKDQQFDAGLAAVVQVLLAKCERVFDNIRNEQDLTELDKIMKEVVFEKAYIDLTHLCIEKMASLSSDEFLQLGKDVAKLHLDEMQITKTKSYLLGAKISAYTGMEVLAKGVSLLSPEIKEKEEVEILSEVEQFQQELSKKFQ